MANREGASVLRRQHIRMAQGRRDNRSSLREGDCCHAQTHRKAWSYMYARLLGVLCGVVVCRVVLLVTSQHQSGIGAQFHVFVLCRAR